MPGILGKKVGMTRVVADDGSVIPVSVIECMPNEIVHVKTTEKDGYPALVLGFDAYARPTTNRKFKHIAEFRLESDTDKKKGDLISIADLGELQAVKITGTSKGRGYAGVIKRHKFHRGPETHGSHHHRQPGSSSGSRTGTGRTPKGKRFPGHMGVDQKTLRAVPVISTFVDKHLLVVKGPVPGAPNGLIKISC